MLSNDGVNSRWKAKHSTIRTGTCFLLGPIHFVVQSLPWEHVCSQSRYSVTAAVKLRILRSLPSSGRCL
jgi:hypothetical protein